MGMLSDSDAQEVRKMFGNLVRDVHVKVYTQKLECPTCQDTEIILKELERLSERLKVTFRNLQTDREEAERDGVGIAPAITVSDGTHSRVKFYGTPSGYEFMSLLTAIMDAGGTEEPLSAESIEFLDGLETELKMMVFVTPSCPHCPQAAVLACRMAGYSGKVEADILEASEFPELSRRFRVQGVPRTVVNEKFYAEGALPESMVIRSLIKALADDPSGETNLMDYLQSSS